MDQSHIIDFTTKKNPLPLQLQASNRIAVLLWRHRIQNVDPIAGEFITYSWLENQRFDICHQLHVPFVIGGIIDKSINLYRCRLKDWARDYSNISGSNSYHDIIVKYIDYIDIHDDITTARKLFQSDLLTAKEKYRLACKYCWENEIERLWPLVSHSSNIFNPFCKVIRYWNNKMMDKNTQSLEDELSDMVYPKEGYTGWFSAEYFFDRLNAEDRLSIVAELLQFENDKITISILTRLNNQEMNRALDTIGSHVLPRLAKNIMYHEHVLGIWKYLCDRGLKQQMYDALKKIWLAAYHTSSWGERPDRLISVVLYELWIRTSPSFRRQFLADNPVETFFDNLNDTKIEVFSIFRHNVYGGDMSFMLDILSAEELPKRNEIWDRTWRKLIVRALPSDLDRFMKMCFGKEEEIIRFKEGVMMDYDQLESEFGCFIELKKFSELIDYVKFCSSDQQRVENLMRRIIALHHSLHYSRYTEFDNFVSSTFSSPEYAQKFKIEYLFSSEDSKLNALLAELDNGRFEFAIDVCNYVSYELCPSELKQQFLERCTRCLISDNLTRDGFDIHKWREFVSSCAGSEQMVKEFKESIQTDVVMNGLLISVMKPNKIIRFCYETLNESRIFSIIDDFSLWYFESEQAVNEYKLKFNSSRICGLIGSVAKNDHKDKGVDIVLRWIFNYDVKKTDKFKMNYLQKRDDYYKKKRLA